MTNPNRLFRIYVDSDIERELSVFGRAKWVQDLYNSGAYDRDSFMQALSEKLDEALTKNLSQFGGQLRNNADARLFGIPTVDQCWETNVSVSEGSITFNIRNNQPRRLVPSYPRSMKIRTGEEGSFTGTIGGGMEFFFWLRGNKPNKDDNIYPKGTLLTGSGKKPRTLESGDRISSPGDLDGDDLEAKAIVFHDASGERVVRAYTRPRRGGYNAEIAFRRLLRGGVKHGINLFKRSLND